MDFLVDGGRRRHPQKETAVYTGGRSYNCAENVHTAWFLEHNVFCLKRPSTTLRLTKEAFSPQLRFFSQFQRLNRCKDERKNNKSTTRVESLPKARWKWTALSGSYIVHYDCDLIPYQLRRMNHEIWWLCTDSQPVTMDYHSTAVHVNKTSKKNEVSGSCPCCGREDLDLSRYYTRSMMVWLLAWPPPRKLFSIHFNRTLFEFETTAA
jgi:hypothetical protein